MNNIERFREIELLYNQATTLAKKKLLEPRGNEMHIPVLKLLKTEPLNTIIYEIIKDFGFTAHQTAETMTLLKSESGKYIQSSTHRIIKNRNWLIISPNQTIAADNIIIEEKDKQVEFQDGKLHLELLSTPNPKLQTPNHTAQLNADNIKFPMLLRKWKSGDYFYPLGMQKKKKLSRFFIDQKLSLTQKEKIWVIEMNKKIIWVVGLRIDDRFKITGETKTVLQVTWSVAE
jgi:tRNA(Ile)-lysidine synthase